MHILVGVFEVKRTRWEPFLVKPGEAFIEGTPFWTFYQKYSHFCVLGKYFCKVLRAHMFRILEQLLQKWVHFQIQGQIMFKYNNKTKELNYKNMAQSQKKGRPQSRHLSLHLVKYLNTRVYRFFFIVDFEYIF